MTEFTLRESFEVQRAAADCYRYLLDFSTIEQWDPTVLCARKLSPGAPRVGTEFHLDLACLGRRFAMRYRLDELRAPAFLRLRGEGGGVSADDRIHIEALGPERSRIRYEAVLTLPATGPVLGAVIETPLRRMGRRAVAGLRAALAGDTAVPAQADGPTLAQRLLLPAAIDFTRRGYRRMADKAHARYLDGRVVVLTGATSGIGLAAACELSRLGARLILVGRGRERLERAAETVADFAGVPSAIHLVEADLLEAEQRVAALARIRSLATAIDVLINNAGALFDAPQLTADGIERTWAINLLAPYHLTRALLPALRRARGRVINVSSGGQYLQPLRLDRWNETSGTFNGVKAYAQAKRALGVLTQRWAEQYPQIGFHAMHPGWVATPGVARSLPGFNRLLRPALRDPRMGADTIVWLASADAVLLGSGRFWMDRRPVPYDVVPGTRVGAAERDHLVARLAAVAT